MKVVYEDNHLLIVDKQAGELVQGDRTGDESLVDIAKRWLKEKYSKPGNVFCGVIHRIDRPTCGLVVMAKTSKGLSRMNELFRRGEVSKTYWAIVCKQPPHPSGTLTHYLKSVERTNKTLLSPTPRPGYQKAVLSYRQLAGTERYWLLEVNLLTGRKHQIRAQLSHLGCPIKGDLKYGAPRSNPDGGICLQSHRISFTHPVSGKTVDVTAPVPHDTLWQALAQQVEQPEQEKTTNINI